MDRDTMTTQPAEHDYILGTTGFTWNVRRSNGSGAVFSISEGHRDRKAAVARALALGEADGTDVWETAGNGVFSRMRRFRPIQD
jgi:hypothetical protein